MQDKELFQIALGIKSPWYISELRMDASEQRVDIYIDFERGSEFECPECGGLFTAYDSKQRTWRHLDFFQHKAYLHARVPRVECSQHGVKTVVVPWSRSNTGFTLMFESLVVTMCRQMPVSAVADLVDLHEDSVWRILKHYVGKAREEVDVSNLKVVGVDELSVKKHHNYLTVFYDLERARVIHVEKDKTKDVFKGLRDYVKKANGNPDQVDCISMDMYPAYVGGAEEYFNAKIVYDKFHVIKQMNDAVDKVRRREVKENELLKKTRFMWLKNPGNLTEKEKKKFTSIKDLDIKTAKTYQFKLALQRAWEFNVNTAETYLDLWCRWAIRSGIDEVIKMGKTVKNHISGILEAIKSGINNGAVEGLNNKIKTAFKKSYGFKKEEYRETMIFLIAGKLRLPTQS